MRATYKPYSSVRIHRLAFLSPTQASNSDLRQGDIVVRPKPVRRSRDMDLDEKVIEKRQAERQAYKDAGLVKRKVAMHIGYVGTEYSGLQYSDVEHVNTIEKEMQAALYKSGLVTESNSVSLSKIKWSRSSRTDKGVHSLATVVACKILVEEGKFDSDSEGLELADHISDNLPDAIRVFSVQRVNDGFFARNMCTTRTYEYYVPLSVILGNKARIYYVNFWLQTTGDLKEVDEETEKERLRLFGEALSMLCGRHAFHNYTKRKLYIDNNDCYNPRRRREKRRLARYDEEEAESESGESDIQLDAADKPQTERVDFEELLKMERETGRWRFWNYDFKEDNDPSDRVVAPHYRDIISFTADSPSPLVPGGVRAVCCRVEGKSFMLHQIRYMIGSSIAFARGLISRSVLESSLKACIRINLPLALPGTLTLVDNDFSDFPKTNGMEQAFVARWSGNRLQLRAGGLIRQLDFRKSVLMVEINRLLSLPDWERWSNSLEMIIYQEDDDQVKSVLEKYNQWVEEKRRIKAAKAEALEKELAARGIDRETWMKERKKSTNSSS